MTLNLSVSKEAIYAMTRKQFEQECEQLDLFFKKNFCSIEKEQLLVFFQQQETPSFPHETSFFLWVLDETLIAGAVKDRAHSLKRMIQLAQFLFSAGNYAAFFFTISALKHPAIGRLKQSWDQVSSQYHLWFKEQSVLCLNQNLAHLFKVMEKTQAPYCPYLPAFKKHYITERQEGLVDALYEVHRRLKYQIRLSSLSLLSTFVHRVQFWQQQREHDLESSFWNRSLLLE